MRSIINLLKDILQKMLEFTNSLNKKVENELLWTNPSPTSEFEAQAVSLSLAHGDKITIDYWFRNDHKAIATGQAYVGVTTDAGVYIYADGSQRKRVATVSASGITFASALLNGYANNAYCIPYKIYKIKSGGGY